MACSPVKTTGLYDIKLVFFLVFFTELIYPESSYISDCCKHSECETLEATRAVYPTHITKYIQAYYFTGLQ